MILVQTSPDFFPEKAYALGVLLGENLGLPFRLEAAAVQGYRFVLPNEHSLFLSDGFFGQIHGGDYLKTENIPPKTQKLPNPFQAGETLELIYGAPEFAVRERAIDCGLDLIASTFFMLTRWEEYVGTERDRHGRFPASAALAHKAGFLQRPVVDEYAELLWHCLLKLGYSGPRKPRRYQLHLSHDVDYPRLWWSWSQRLRTLWGSLSSRKNPGEAVFWLKNHVFRRQDPFDTFAELMRLSEKAGVVSHFNFMGERPKTSDAWYPLQHPDMKNLMQRITERGHKIGFHASYEAFRPSGQSGLAGAPWLLGMELASLRAISPQPIESGRQHFLRFAAPHTWQQWNDAGGLLWDSTLGYPEQPGFRCGSCQAFPVFNFLTRQPLALREKPLIAMDVSLALYQKSSPEAGAALLEQLRAQVRKHGGEFVLLWHNSFWNTPEARPWQQVYKEFLHG